MAALRLPALAPAGLLLDRLEDVLPTLAWTIQTGELAAPDVPPVPMLPWQLGDFLLATTTSYQARDQVWAAIVTRSRRSDPAGTGWRLVALGLALAGLRGFRRRIHVTSAQDLPDVHADLVEGFLIRLGTIDTGRPNIAGRLIGSAIGRAARRYRDHLDRPRPAEIAHHQPRPARPDPGSTEICLYRSAARLAQTGTPLDPVDLNLVTLTRLDGHSMVEAADLYKLPLERAYKRRQRAEQRLSDLLLSQPDDTDRPTRQAAVSGATAGARAAWASAEPATRQTAVPRERR